MFESIAETLIEGAGADNFVATCNMLEAAVAEMQRRHAQWRAMGQRRHRPRRRQARQRVRAAVRGGGRGAKAHPPAADFSGRLRAATSQT
jgi:hypothetical protein